MEKFLILFTLIILNCNVYSQDVNNYLKITKKNFDELFLDHSVLNNYDYFFINENHGYHDNLLVTTKLFNEVAALNKSIYFIAEIDYLGAKLAEQYIETGNIMYLDSLFRGNGTFFQTDENYAFYQYLRKLKLKNNINISVIGIDVINSSYESFKLAQNLFIKNNIENKLVDSISFYIKSNTDYIKRVNFAEKLLSATNNYQLPLKDKNILKFLFQNVLNYYNSNISDNWDNTRDSLMYQNFIKLKEIYQIPNNAKLIFLFGRDHGYQKSSRKTKWLGCWLIKENKKIFTIYYLYYNGIQQIPKYFIPKMLSILFKNDKQYTYIKGTSDNRYLSGHKKGIKKVVKSSENDKITFYNLSLTETPFKSIKLLLDNPKKEYYTLDYIQAIVLIKNSKPSKQLNLAFP